MDLVETGGYSSAELIAEAQSLVLDSLSLTDAVRIGEATADLAAHKKLPVSIEVRLGSWTVYHISLEGSSDGHDSWISRKWAVVNHSKNSSLLELVKCEELGLSWYEANTLPEDAHAANGGAVPLYVKNQGMTATLIVSGLAGPDDHRLAVAGIRAFKHGEGLQE